MQLLNLPIVAFDVALDLGLPVFGVRRRQAGTPLASVTMPKAAVDEDRCGVALEHDIRAPRQASNILSEPKPLAMEIRSNPPLR